MTPLEAFELTIEKIKELQKNGIEIEITPSISREFEDTIRKYKGKPGRIDPEHWVNVAFRTTDKSEMIKINELANYLGLVGVSFDTGGYLGYREWELDWSFKYTGKENEEWREARQTMEDIIDTINQEGIDI